MESGNLKKLLFSVILCQAAGIIGSIFTSPSIPTWYAGITKPGFFPPNWLFAPVWIALFFLMGVSFYLVWVKGLKNKENNIAVSAFGIQLFLNILWSALFFGLHNPFLAFLEIIILWLAILATIVFFYRISKKAGYLLVPYILWVSFAAFLNYNIWILNI